MKNNIYTVLLAALMISNLSAKQLYEIVFVNTTDQEFSYNVDLWADIEKGVGQKMFGGGDKEGKIDPMDAAADKPEVTHTNTSYLINKVTIKSADGKTMHYKIPRKAGKDLSGKNWVFEIIQDGKGIKVCRKWAHTQVQSDTTLAAEIIGIVAAAVLIASGVRKAVQSAEVVAAKTEVAAGKAEGAYQAAKLEMQTAARAKDYKIEADYVDNALGNLQAKNIQKGYPLTEVTTVKDSLGQPVRKVYAKVISPGKFVTNQYGVVVQIAEVESTAADAATGWAAIRSNGRSYMIREADWGLMRGLNTPEEVALYKKEVLEKSAQAVGDVGHLEAKGVGFKKGSREIVEVQGGFLKEPLNAPFNKAREAASAAKDAQFAYEAKAAAAKVAATLAGASAIVIGALEIAAQTTKNTALSAWNSFKDSLGLSTKLHKAGCSYFK